MHWLRTILIGITASILTACGDSDTPTPEPQPSQRMILVYMVANNSLGSGQYDALDINEMVEAAQLGFGDNRVVLFHSDTGGNQILSEVTPDGLVTLTTYDQSASALAPARIQQVIADSRRLAPASDYAMVLWSHADGWLAPVAGSDAAQHRAFGDDRGRHLSIPDLAKALEPWSFNFIYFDCCYMANVETLYEMRHCARWAIASAIELPARGMNYTVNLPLLLQPDPDLVGAARATFNYYDSYDDYRRTCAMSVIDLQALDDLAAATRQIYAGSSVPDPSYQPQRFTPGASCYLYDLGDYIDARCDTATDDLQRWHSALNKAVVYSAATPSIWGTLDIRAHCGLSTYILSSPTQSSTRGYDTLQWWSDVASAQF